MNRYLRWPQVHELVNLSRPTVWRLEKDGFFPRRRKLGKNSVGWLESEIIEWINTRKEAA